MMNTYFRQVQNAILTGTTKGSEVHRLLDACIWTDEKYAETFATEAKKRDAKDAAEEEARKTADSQEAVARQAADTAEEKARTVADQKNETLIADQQKVITAQQKIIDELKNAIADLKGRVHTLEHSPAVNAQPSSGPHGGVFFS